QNLVTIKLTYTTRPRSADSAFCSFTSLAFPYSMFLGFLFAISSCAASSYSLLPPQAFLLATGLLAFYSSLFTALAFSLALKQTLRFTCSISYPALQHYPNRKRRTYH